MSNRRKIKPVHPFAHLDGLHLTDSCCDTVIKVSGYGRVGMLHDEWCPALGDDAAARDAARLKCNQALMRVVPNAISFVEIEI